MQKPKIVHLTSVHPVFDPRIFHKEVVSLAKAGYEVVLIAPHSQDEVVDGVHIKAIRRAKGRSGRPATICRILKLARKEHASVYQFHDPELIVIAPLLKFLTGANVIYDVHEDVRKQILSKDWIPAGLRRLFSFAYGLIEKVCLSFVDRIVIVIDDHRGLYPRSKKVVCIRNYPLANTFSAGATPAVRQDSGKKRLIYVGAISANRGAFQLLEAMEMLGGQSHSCLLELVGKASAATENELRCRIVRRRLDRSVKIEKQAPFSQIDEILASSDIGLCVLMPLPNYIESLPTKLFEYMAAGLPVIASNFPIFKEIVEGGNCGLTVDPLEAKAIADAIAWLIDNPEAAREMGENGRRAVNERYSWETQEKELLGMYEELLTSNGSH